MKPPGFSGDARAAAARWIVVHDRGMTAEEAREFRAWLAADSRHGEIWAERLEVWARFDALAQDRATSARPPLVRAGTSRRAWGAFGLAAVLVLGAAVFRGGGRETEAGRRQAEPATTSLVAAERRFLPDGSVADLTPGADLTATFDDGERRVRLRAGSGHFQVAHDPRRPFIVVTPDGVEVRALGTAFDVRLAGGEVEVRVASGRVQVTGVPEGGEIRKGTVLPVLTAGEGVILSGNASAAPRFRSALVVAAPEAPERYEFERTPLAVVVAELNRRGEVRLEIAEPGLGDLPIYASFRAGAPDTFLRLLAATGELAIEERAGIYRLRRAP